ncbi:MAG: ABC transporter ATP-binding protein [Bauldia sp.]|nr:ABC transporter ATP-binding protein [Bauldia sp.]
MNALTAIIEPPPSPLPDSAPLLAVRGLSIFFGGRIVPTVQDVSFDIARGETLALVGESGSGKSIIAHTIAGILARAATVSATTISFNGIELAGKPAAVEALRGRRIGMVFQNARAALSPTLSVGAQIGDVIARHRRLRRTALRAAIVQALASVKIPDPERRAKAYPHELSGGMCQRVMLALAMAGEPDLLIADEPTTGLDNTTQAAILDLLAAEAGRRRMATLFITHDLGLARDYADRVAVLHAGQLVEEGRAATVFDAPRHPYSAKLVRAVPAKAATVADLGGIPGKFPDLSGPVPACRFADRCDRAVDRCRVEVPRLEPVPPDGMAACWRPLA